MTRLLYEKHIPADPLLAPACALMPAGQAQRLAGWLAEALGGPAAGGHDGGLAQAAGFGPGALTEEQRARWVALAAVAADESGWPTDPGFRSAFASCIEWLSRTALAQSQSATDGPPPAPPRWDWGPGGPPTAGAATVGQAVAPEQPLPGPDQPVGFAAHIKPLFRARDRQSMSFAFDLWSYDDVRTRAAAVLSRLEDGSMPCDGAWPAAKIEVFQRWIDTGMQP